jgi:acrylyl-CoA reductase (NADPH)
MSTLPDQFPAFVATKSTDADGNTTVARGVGELRAEDLAPGEVTVRVLWSSVNYKDALATLADGGVARISPLVAGIDVGGVVVAVDGSADVAVGDHVIAHGYDIGVARHGAYAHYCRLPANQVLSLPPGLTIQEAMAIGTAGFTAAQSVYALERAGLRIDAGPVLVTGATGGVGSTAVAMLAQRGFEVAAATGKADEHEYLRGLGATTIIDRSELAVDAARPLEKERWGGAVDCVGGTTLSTVIRQLRYGASVAASGLTGGVGLSGTVLPHILRGVSLLGIDSVQVDMITRAEIWRRCASDLKPHNLLSSIAVTTNLDGLDAALTAIRAGAVRGRTLVEVSPS